MLFLFLLFAGKGAENNYSVYLLLVGQHIGCSRFVYSPPPFLDRLEAKITNREQQAFIVAVAVFFLL